MISVVICSIDAAKFARVSQNYSAMLAGEPFEIVGIHDARGMAEGYNRGLARSRGEVVIFSHDDIEIVSPDFKARLLGHLESADLLGVAGTARLCDGRWVSSGPPFVYGQIAQVNRAENCLDVLIWSAAERRIGEIQAMDGVFLCARRAVVESVGFDEQAFAHFHLYDIDFTYRAYLAGHRLAVCPDLLLIHESYGKFDARWAGDEALFRQKHQGALSPPFRRPFHVTLVKARTREEMIEVMTPPHWR